MKSLRRMSTVMLLAGMAACGPFFRKGGGGACPPPTQVQTKAGSYKPSPAMLMPDGGGLLDGYSDLKVVVSDDLTKVTQSFKKDGHSYEIKYAVVSKTPQ